MPSSMSQSQYRGCPYCGARTLPTLHSLLATVIALQRSLHCNAGYYLNKASSRFPQNEVKRSQLKVGRVSRLCEHPLLLRSLSGLLIPTRLDAL